MISDVVSGKFWFLDPRISVSLDLCCCGWNDQQIQAFPDGNRYITYSEAGNVIFWDILSKSQNS
jgi:hypothetical protein